MVLAAPMHGEEVCAVLSHRSTVWIINVYIYFLLEYKPVRIEAADGTELTDWSAKPPKTVYVIGVRLNDL